MASPGSSSSAFLRQSPYPAETESFDFDIKNNQDAYVTTCVQDSVLPHSRFSQIGHIGAMAPQNWPGQAAELQYLAQDQETARDIYRWLVATGWFNQSNHGTTLRAHQVLDEQQNAINAARDALHRPNQSLSNEPGPNQTRQLNQPLQYKESSQAPHSPGSSTHILSEIIVEQENFGPRHYGTQEPDTRSYYDEDRSRRNASRLRRGTGHCHDRSPERATRPSYANAYRLSPAPRSRSRNRHHGKPSSRSHRQQHSRRRQDNSNHHEFDYQESPSHETGDHRSHGHRRDTGHQHHGYAHGRRSATPQHACRDGRAATQYRERSLSPSLCEDQQYQQNMDYEQPTRATSLSIAPAPVQSNSTSSATIDQFPAIMQSEHQVGSSKSVANAKPQDRDQQKEKNNLIHPKPFNAGEPGQTRFFVIRSYNYDNIYQAQSNGVWATQKTNEAVLTDAFNTCSHVVLLFGVNTGPFYGYARMTCLPSPTIPAPSWYRYLKMEATDPFRIEWFSTGPCETHHVGHVRNAFNDDLPVTRSRDGQEISEAAGLEMVRIMNREARKLCNGGSVFGTT